MARLHLVSEQSPLLESTTETDHLHLQIEVSGRQDTSRHVNRRRILKHHPCHCHCFLHGLLTIFWDDEGEHVAQGFASIFLLGSVLGLALPRSSHLHGRWYPLISNILGYCYALAWSVSYYPQLILNYKLQSTEGLSVDFCTLSVFGCACYASLNVAMLYFPQIQTLYGKRHDGHASLVQPSDVAFSIHALILSTIWLGQTWYYNRRSFEHHNRVSKTTIALLGVMSAFVIAHGLLIMTLAPCKTVQYWPCDKLNWLDFLYVVTSFKIAITLLSYVPQALLNFSLKSTDGFNIWGMLLDAFGGIFSVLQILLDSWNENDLSGISGDAAKLALALLTIGLDVVFFVQHYILYPKHGRINIQTIAQK